MARPRLLLTTTTRKNISSEYSSTSHDQTITGVLSIIGSTVDVCENSGTPYLFTLRGSDIAASSGVSVEAGGDISITVADASSSSETFDKKTRSGFSFSGGGGGIGISYGKSEQGKNARDDSDYHAGIANAAKRRRRRMPPSTGLAFSIDFTAHPHVHFYRRNTCITNGRKP